MISGLLEPDLLQISEAMIDSIRTTKHIFLILINSFLLRGEISLTAKGKMRWSGGILRNERLAGII